MHPTTYTITENFNGLSPLVKDMLLYTRNIHEPTNYINLCICRLIEVMAFLSALISQLGEERVRGSCLVVADEREVLGYMQG